ncbi:peptidase family M20/M25/M40 protein [Apiospora aurea]|uniref:Peptidase family M20/M25/M40 protein n=1 Tax=Apiospora aurea TaxID=335848 RepID=A0ABR1QKA7_9PEZI
MEQEHTRPSQRSLSELKAQSTSLRRARPPDIITMGDENRAPLRQNTVPDKMNKRESLVGLRSIFGRSKVGKDGREAEGPSTLRETSRSSGIRASLAEISNWPYALHSQKSDLSLSALSPLSPTHQSAASSPLRPQPSTPRLKQSSSGKIKGPAASFTGTPRTGRGGAVTSWESPPLFQVYPQAIKHATLPAPSVSADALLRLQGARNSVMLREDMSTSTMNLEPEEGGEKKVDKAWKKHHRNMGSKNFLEWTTKIYVLVTSGHLLQYTTEGSFDRLPERVLQLTRDSAVFASDMIPGKHWVLQVASLMDPSGIPANDSRSLLAKLRGSERRHASNFLMVFEAAEDMDSWLALLRHAIEALGGKKKLTETGKPKEDEIPAGLRSQSSQRTLVVRDPERFTNVMRQDFAWAPEKRRKSQQRESSEWPSSECRDEVALDAVLDDISTTESHYSSDGQVLDNLRDSNNRLSFISSGQRTYLTSEGSSPACSPTRASFTSHVDEHHPQQSEHHPETRLRPNAQAISNRRQSMQPYIASFDCRVEPVNRPHSTMLNVPNNKETSPQVSVRQSVPNFSVPNSAHKRFSSASGSDIADPVQWTESETPNKSGRKPPPTALALSRPLSVVVDQPSPQSPVSPQDVLARKLDAISSRKAADESPQSPAVSVFSTWVLSQSDRPSESERLPSRGSSLTNESSSSTITLSDTKHSKRYRSMTSMCPNKELAAEPSPEVERYILPTVQSLTRGSSHSSTHSHDVTSRAFSSVGNHDADRRRTMMARTRDSSYKRASLTAEERTPRRSLISLSEHVPVGSMAPSLPPKSVARTSATLPRRDDSPKPLSPAEQSNKLLLSRRSMPHLTNVPPPAPPPTCALPPIPKKYQEPTPRSLKT